MAFLEFTAEMRGVIEAIAKGGLGDALITT